MALNFVNVLSYLLSKLYHLILTCSIYNMLLSISKYSNIIKLLSISSWRGLIETTACDKVCQWLEVCRWFSSGTLVSSTNRNDPCDITEIWFKVASNTITPPSGMVSRFWRKKSILLRTKTLYNFFWFSNLLTISIPVEG